MSSDPNPSSSLVHVSSSHVEIREDFLKIADMVQDRTTIGGGRTIVQEVPTVEVVSPASNPYVERTTRHGKDLVKVYTDPLFV